MQETPFGLGGQRDGQTNLSLPYKNIEELAMHLNEVDPLSEGARSFLGQKARYPGEVIAILVGRCCVLRPH